MSMEKLPRSAVFVVSKSLPGKTGHQIIDQVNHWIKNSGIEWTNARLKAIRTALIQVRAGNLELAISVYQSNSISYHKGSLLPKGVFGPVGYLWINSQRPAVLRRISAVLRLYTCLRLDKLSVKQYEKAKQAINGDPSYDKDKIISLSNEIFTMAEELKKGFPKLEKPNLGNLKAFSSTHRSISTDPNVKKQPFGFLLTSLLSSLRIPLALQYVNPCDELHQFLTEICYGDNQEAGHIAFLQEGGCKGRVIAVPNAWIQYLMEPLHKALDKYTRTLPNSAVHDHNKGAYYIKQNFSVGNKLFCFDLSSATDRFPLPIQTALLEGLGLETYKKAFIDLRTGWKVKSPFGDEMWSYNTGQPMGMYGSFSLFHLTHYMLLKFCCKILKLSDDIGNPWFMVLGDDVIIRHPGVARLYEIIMSDLDVELSPTKSIVSDRVGEFAGFLAIKTNKTVTVFRPYKYGKDPRSVNSPLNLMYSIGQNLGNGSPFWDKRVKQFNPTIPYRNPDLTPLIKCDDKPGKMPDKLDFNLLLGLLQRYFSEYVDPDQELLYSNMLEEGFIEDEDDIPVVDDLLIRSAERFLQQETSNSKDPLGLKELGIGLPSIIEEKKNSHGVSQTIKNDPLMRSVIQNSDAFA